MTHGSTLTKKMTEGITIGVILQRTFSLFRLLSHPEARLLIADTHLRCRAMRVTHLLDQIQCPHPLTSVQHQLPLLRPQLQQPLTLVSHPSDAPLPPHSHPTRPLLPLDQGGEEVRALDL